MKTVNLSNSSNMHFRLQKLEGPEDIEWASWHSKGYMWLVSFDGTMSSWGSMKGTPCSRDLETELLGCGWRTTDRSDEYCILNLQHPDLCFVFFSLLMIHVVCASIGWTRWYSDLRTVHFRRKEHRNRWDILPSKCLSQVTVSLRGWGRDYPSVGSEDRRLQARLQGA